MSWLGRRSLRTKLAMMALVSTLASTLTVAWIGYDRMIARETELALEQLEVMAKFYARDIGGAFAMMEEDARVLAGTPPIEGIIRARQAGTGQDPLDGSTEEVWKLRLATIFKALLHTRPQYTQARYISRADDWREIVRVNRTDGRIATVPEADLQRKADEDYLDGADRLGIGDMHYSSITYNREWGRTAGRPTLRLLLPVFDAAGTLFGVVVLNADFETLLGRAAPDPGPDYRITAINAAGDWFLYGADDGRLRFHLDPDWTSASEAARLGATGARRRPEFRTETEAAYVVRLGDTRPGSGFDLDVVTEMPLARLSSTANRTLMQTLGTAAVLAILAVLAALCVATAVPRPMVLLGQAMRNGANADGLKTAAFGEARDLADAFVAMSLDVQRQTLLSKVIVSGAADGIVTYDTDGLIEEINPAAEAIFGYAADEVLGRKVSMLMPDRADDSPDAATGRTVIGLRKDGGEVPLEISISSGDFAGTVHHVAIVRDITTRRQAEDTLARLVAALQRSNDELDKFAYIASHDLKAPLRVIDNASRWLAEDLAEHITADAQESIDLVHNRVSRMERLLDDLLEHSRIGRDTGAVQIVAGDRLIEEMIDLLDLPSSFMLDVSPAFADIHLPRMPIETVLLNLISNAARHHDRDSGRIGVTVEDQGDRYLFAVEDDGPGIPPQYHERIFEMFQTLQPRDRRESSGMGLAMVRKHVEIAEGSIRVISDGGRGTRFEVIWPKTPAVLKGKAA